MTTFLNVARMAQLQAWAMHHCSNETLVPTTCSFQGAVSTFLHSFSEISLLILTGQARHGGCLFRVGSIRPRDHWRVDDGTASFPDSAAAQELENHTNFAANSGSTPGVNSGDHQCADPSDYVFFSLRAAGATGTLECVG